MTELPNPFQFESVAVPGTDQTGAVPPGREQTAAPVRHSDYRAETGNESCGGVESRHAGSDNVHKPARGSCVEADNCQTAVLAQLAAGVAPGPQDTHSSSALPPDADHSSAAGFLGSLPSGESELPVMAAWSAADVSFPDIPAFLKRDKPSNRAPFMGEP